jgi:superfamily II DNA/RNA helicase
MANTGLGRLPLQKFVLTDDFDLSASGKAEHGHTTKVANETTASTDEHDDTTDSSSNNDSDNDVDEKQETSQREVKATRPKIPAGLKQEYIFMPARVRDAYLVAVLRRLLANAGRRMQKEKTWKNHGKALKHAQDEEEDDDGTPKARSAILFVATCERCALVSQLLTGLGIENVALHSLLSQNRRLAALGQFQSEQVRILVSTDVGSRG